METSEESFQGRRSGDCALNDKLRSSNGRASYLSQGKRLSVTSSAKSPASTKVKFYRDGDINFGGTDVCISRQRYRSLEALMQDLNRRMNLPRGVRAIYTPGGVTKINSMQDFQQGGSYVCSSKANIKKIDYSAAKSPQWLPFSKKTRYGTTGPFLVSRSLQIRSTVCNRGHCKCCGRKIVHGKSNLVLTIRSQWVKGTRTLLVNRHMLRSWDDALSDIANVAGVPRAMSPHLFNVETGQPVSVTTVHNGVHYIYIQSFQSLQSRLHIANCNDSHDNSIGKLESHMNSDGIIMRETLPF